MVAPWRIVSAQCSRLCWALRRAGDALLLLLLDIPEYRGWRGHEARHVLAGGACLVPLSKMDMRHDLALVYLHGLGDLLLLGGIGRTRKVVAQLLHPGVTGPAERGLVAARIHEARH